MWIARGGEEGITVPPAFGSKDIDIFPKYSGASMLQSLKQVDRGP